MTRQQARETVQNPPSDAATDPAVEAASEGRPSAEDYSSTGNTVVKTYPGHAVVPENEKLPVVTSDGVKMSKADADAVVEQWPNFAYIETSEED